MKRSRSVKIFQWVWGWISYSSPSPLPKLQGDSIQGNHDVLLCSRTSQNVKKQTFENKNSVFDPGTTTYAPAPSRLTGEVLYLRVTFLNRRSRMRHFRPCQPFTADNMRQRRGLSLVLLSQVSRNNKRLQDILDTKSGFLFGHSYKNSRGRKLKIQGNNWKLKLKSQKVGIFLWMFEQFYVKIIRIRIKTSENG